MVAELAGETLAQVAEAQRKLGRWLVLFEARLAAAEAVMSPLDPKDLVAFLAAHERLLKIAKLAQLMIPEANDGAHATMDADVLRQLFSGEE